MKNFKKVASVFFALIFLALVGFTSIKKSSDQVSEVVEGKNQEPAKTPAGTTTVRYIADLTTVFPNPERGWHNRRDVDGRGGNDNRDFSDVKAAGHTLVHSYLRLDDFKETDNIPQSYLDDMQEALDAIRANGLKIILRPTHVWSESPTVPEARILKHIEQLNAVISKNADVISHLEVGYLGKWGEWHSGLYTDLSSRADGDTRYRIVKRILDTTPEKMPIAMRYPMHIREILQELPVPEDSEPLTQVQRDRIGHHSDCFLYNENDRGTYARLDIWFGNQTLEQQKQYTFDMIASYGGNKIVGGETCSPQIARIDATQNEMAEANWTEININFWKDAIEMWKKRLLPASGNDPEESEFTRISRKLGYRLRLIDATFPMSATAGGSFTIAANLNNDGYASIIKPRPIFLVFDNGTNRYNIELSGIDARKWVSGPVKLSMQTVTLPANMAPGKYKLALWLPDASENLQSRPEYSVRFANNDVWDATKGYNLLTDSLIITANAQKASNDAVKIGKIKFPYHFQYEGNPLSRMHSAADPDVQVWEDVVWMYCSQDRNVDSTKHKHHYDAMDGYHVFSSTDMINWTDHGEIFHSSDVSWAWEKGGFLWAPGSARKNGKYYLYYPIKDKEGKWRIGVAIGDSPKGPFKDTGHPIEGLSGIDPRIFIDDDGEVYIYNNPGVVAKLKPNMIELAGKVRKIEYARKEVMENDTLKFNEGAFMHKKDSVYYFSYTNWKNKTHQGFYAIGDNPYGPFEWKGPMAPRPAGAQDHHSIIDFKGQSYYFYHIAIKKFPKYKESQGRIACYDKLYYNQDGTIQMVKHTR